MTNKYKVKVRVVAVREIEVILDTGAEEFDGWLLPEDRRVTEDALDSDPGNWEIDWYETKVLDAESID